MTSPAFGVAIAEIVPAVPLATGVQIDAAAALPTEINAATIPTTSAAKTRVPLTASPSDPVDERGEPFKNPAVRQSRPRDGGDRGRRSGDRVIRSVIGLYDHNLTK